MIDASQPVSGPVRDVPHWKKDSERDEEWYTPPHIFDALGLAFDLDPASPLDGPVPWLPVSTFYTEREDGLSMPWKGRVWLNPPYGRECALWMDRMAAHGNGVALVFARTDTRWFQRAVAGAGAACFLLGRLSFMRQGDDVVMTAQVGDDGTVTRSETLTLDDFDTIMCDYTGSWDAWEAAERLFQAAVDGALWGIGGSVRGVD